MSSGDSDLVKGMIEAEKLRREQIERDAVDFSLDDFLQADRATYESFITPRQALARFSFGDELAVQQLQRELRFGRVNAICDEGAIFYNNQSYSVELAILHRWHWWQQMPRVTDDFWDTGYLEIMIPEKIGGLSFKSCGSVRYFDVRFDPSKLPQEKGADFAQAKQSASATPGKNKGGRPPKPWWDELWAFIGAELYNGGLKPSKLADIESAMHKWVIERGDTVGETPIRKCAKLVWDAIQEEDQN